jgi:hypothetical protein
MRCAHKAAYPLPTGEGLRWALLRSFITQRHAELGSASIVPREPEGLEAKWTLKRVQGDGVSRFG